MSTGSSTNRAFWNMFHCGSVLLCGIHEDVEMIWRYNRTDWCNFWSSHIQNTNVTAEIESCTVFPSFLWCWHTEYIEHCLLVGVVSAAGVTVCGTVVLVPANWVTAVMMWQIHSSYSERCLTTLYWGLLYSSKSPPASLGWCDLLTYWDTLWSMSAADINRFLIRLFSSFRLSIETYITIYVTLNFLIFY